MEDVISETQNIRKFYELAMMRVRGKRYWVVEITKSFETVFRKRLKVNLSVKEISIILQGLVCRMLSPEEVIAASVQKPNGILEVRVDRSPNHRRTMIWMPAFPDFRASHGHENELAEYPEILPEEW